MKATGIVRRIDELGRIVLPIELRRTMDIEERDRVEIYLEEDLIIVRKFEQTCLFCGTARNLIAFKESAHSTKKPTIKRRASYAQTAEAPNIRCFRCLPKISRNRKAYRLRFCALHPDTERGRSSADGAIRRDRAGTVCLILSPHRR